MSLFGFVKNILGQLYYQEVSVMTNSCKDVNHYSIIRAGRQVVYHQKCSFLSIKGTQIRQPIVKFHARVFIKYFFYILRNKIGFVRVVGNNFSCVFDKFKH